MSDGGLGRRLVWGHVLAAVAGVAVVCAGVAFGLPLAWSGAIALLAAGVLAIALSLRITRWVQEPLIEIAGTLATSVAGQPPGVDERGPLEVRDLARALNEVAEGVASRLSELNRESALREQILSSMSEGVMLAEESGRIIYANPAAHVLLPGAKMLPAQFRASGQVELTLHHPRRREVKAACVQFDDGRRMVAMQDVTEAKRIEAMRRDFVADASHELKTPVASIQAVAETLEMAVVDDPGSVPAFMKILLNETRRMSALVQDLLDLARLEARLEGRPPGRGPVCISDAVEHESDRIRPHVEKRGLTLREEVADGVMVPGSEEDLELALRNLLENALRHTLTGEIGVCLRQVGQLATIEVTDTGEGIPGKDIGRIFERFYRVDRARSRETGGTGLGLAIVRHVVEQHGGSVRVESDLGRGSRFTVTLPASSAPTSANEP